MTLPPPPDPTPTTPGVPAGWYPDPRTGQTRWWDGNTWGIGAPPAAPTRPVNGTGIAGFIVGLIAFFTGLLPILGLTLAIFGLALSVEGMTRAKKKGAGTGLAVTGLILSILAGLAGLLLILIPILIGVGNSSSEWGHT